MYSHLIDPVALTKFSFSTLIKNEYRDGTAACQLSYVVLITDNAPIIIPLSIKGYVSELNLRSVNHTAAGKKADLSDFGVDFSEWVKVDCKSDSGRIGYYINEKLAYEFPLPGQSVNIVGICYGFQGTGAVKNIRLSSNGKPVFEAFWPH